MNEIREINLENPSLLHGVYTGRQMTLAVKILEGAMHAALHYAVYNGIILRLTNTRWSSSVPRSVFSALEMSSADHLVAEFTLKLNDHGITESPCCTENRSMLRGVQIRTDLG